MLAPLEVSEARLEQRNRNLESDFKRVLGLAARELRLQTDRHSDGLGIGLDGPACERIDRHRGGRVAVAPFCDLPGGLKAWIGYREIWDQSRARHCSFRESGLTLFFGRVGDPVKPQALRLEWPGIRDWTGTGLAFQAPGAGHPHWQMDLLESLRQARRNVSFDDNHEDRIEEFGESDTEGDVTDIIAGLTLERMHLASGASWWMNRQSPAQGRHQNAPPDLAGLTLWINEALVYLRQELGRCQLRR